MQIVFVCTGNTCRSSMAEVLAKQWLKENAGERTDIRIMSAGLAAWPGSPASQQAVAVMKEAGLNLRDHKATLFSKEIAADSDIILTMTKNHKQAVINSYPEAAAKVFSLAEFAGREDGDDIPDPFGRPVEVYRTCAAKIKELVDAALRKIVKPGENR